MTTIYFSCPVTSRVEALRRWDWEQRPLAILTSYVYLREWQTIRPYVRNPKALMLDSGAFTAYQTGRTVDIDDLVRETRSDEWDEAVTLDVIGSWEGSKRNADYMRAAGSKAMPVFHLGEPWHLLEYYAANWPKVGLGGMVGVKPLKSVLKWIEQCFARVWPKKLHSFGRTEDAVLMRFPFHSADTSTWSIAAGAYRVWPHRRNGRMSSTHLSVDGKEMLLHGTRAHMEVLYAREQQLITRWRSTLAELEEERKDARSEEATARTTPQ